MKTAPNLQELQRWLKWIITDPRGVEKALPMDPDPQIAWLQSNKISVIDRLNVYAEGYFSRIHDCLSQDFSRTKKALGEDFFAVLIAQYLKVYPSRFTSIDEVGFKLASFIAEYRESSVPRWIVDLALFEWKWVESFYSYSLENKNLDWCNDSELAANPRLKLDPSLRLLKSQWPLAEIIHTIDAQNSVDSQNSVYSQKTVDLQQDLDIKISSHKTQEVGILIYRFNDVVLWESLESPLFDLLQNLKKGIPLMDSFARLDDLDPAEISKNFSHWVELGIICGTLAEESKHDE